MSLIIKIILKIIKSKLKFSDLIAKKDKENQFEINKIMQVGYNISSLIFNNLNNFKKDKNKNRFIKKLIILETLK